MASATAAANPSRPRPTPQPAAAPDFKAWREAEVEALRGLLREWFDASDPSIGGPGSLTTDNLRRAADQPTVTIHVCRSDCIDGPNHSWDGPEYVSEDGSMSSATCSKCGMTSFHHSMLTGP